MPTDTEWVKRRLTPHPLGTYTSTLNIKGPVGNNLPRTYIACTNPSYAALQASRDWVKAQQGWRWAEIATGHDAMVMAPDELTRMLIERGERVGLCRLHPCAERARDESGSDQASLRRGSSMSRLSGLRRATLIDPLARGRRGLLITACHSGDGAG